SGGADDLVRVVVRDFGTTPSRSRPVPTLAYRYRRSFAFKLLICNCIVEDLDVLANNAAETA
ncbi:hypothetical protein, partial [Rhizobium sullae]|uniref:hypothetical protein n=1 Tax=Rhizobium sullae TaxID=50338 RepID=UPI001A9CC437